MEHGGANADTIWKKWMRVSNWIDLVFDEFDRVYPWGSQPNDEPSIGPAANPLGPGPAAPAPAHASLRALYAYWIEKYMAEIETNADAWIDLAKKNFEKLWDKKKMTADERKWATYAFHPR